MQKCKYLLFLLFFFLFTNSVNADEINYIPDFDDDFLKSVINSLKYDEESETLYVNETPISLNSNQIYTTTIENIEINFIYNPENSRLTVSYLKPEIEFTIIRVSVKTTNNKTYLYVKNGQEEAQYYQGVIVGNKIVFGNITLQINDSRFETFEVYLDIDNKEIIFINGSNYNFKVKQNSDTEIKILLNGSVNENKIYALNDPMKANDAINGSIDEDQVNEYLTSFEVILSNNDYVISKNVTLKKIMEKWNAIGSNEFEKDNIVIACTNLDRECAVYPKSAFLVNDYNYRDVEEDKNNLVDGSKDTPSNLRIYSDYLYSFIEPTEENVEVIKQEREVYKEFKNWSDYQSEQCVETEDKKCRYKTFYTKSTYALISSTPVYSDWILQGQTLIDPIETTDTEYTKGPYSVCLKYDEKIIEHKSTQCLARDNTKYNYIVHCKNDFDADKFCVSTTSVKRGTTYSLEPVDESGREICNACVVNRGYAVTVDESGDRYAEFTVLGKRAKVYAPNGKCTNVKEEVTYEITRGDCIERGSRYDWYKREYLYDNNVYSDTPTVEYNLETCVELENKTDGKIVCQEEIKSSYSNATLRYSEWHDVSEFSNLSNVEQRFKYRTYKTYGTKIISKKIESGEYSEDEINNILVMIAEALTRVEYTSVSSEYNELKEEENSLSFINEVYENLAIIKNEEIFAPIIHILEKEINLLETLSFKNFEGSKDYSIESSINYEFIEESLDRSNEVKTEKEIVFFDNENTEKISNTNNWLNETELLEEIENKTINDSDYKLVINKDDLNNLKKWRANNNENLNCEFIRNFADLVIKPENFRETLLKTSGCEVEP